MLELGGRRERRCGKMLQHFLEMLDNHFFCSNTFRNIPILLKNVGFLNSFFTILGNVATFFENVGQNYAASSHGAPTAMPCGRPLAHRRTGRSTVGEPACQHAEPDGPRRVEGRSRGDAGRGGRREVEEAEDGRRGAEGAAAQAHMGVCAAAGRGGRGGKGARFSFHGVKDSHRVP
jgi:hypothetical protein